MLCFRTAYLIGENKKYTHAMHSLDPNATFVPILPTPYYSYFPFNIEHSPVYEIAVSYQIFCVWIYGIYISAIDTILTGYLIHIKAQFLILKNYISLYIQKAEEQCVSFCIFPFLYYYCHLLFQMAESGLRKEEIDKLIESYTNSKSPVVQEALPPPIQKYASRIVKECARHHSDIVRLCEKVEDEFSVLILLQFLASLTMLCFNLFQLYIVSTIYLSHTDCPLTQFFFSVGRSKLPFR